MAALNEAMFSDRSSTRSDERGTPVAVSPWLGPNCRFDPTCSEYAIEALETHGAWRGSLLTLRRLSRCHPWGGSGYDPVPEVAEREHDAG